MADIFLAHAYFLKHDVIEQRVMKPYPPLGILCLSAYLKRAGFTVEVFDATFRDPQDFQEAVRRIRPRIVGIYANIITRDNVFRLTRIARDNGVKYVVCGGPDAPEWADVYLQNGVDIIGTNEGERTLEALIPWLDERGMSGLEAFPGIIYRRGGKVWRTPPREVIANLDTLPWPDRDVLVMEDYFRAWQSRHGERSVSLITARGCPFHCAWCSSEVFGHSHRQRSPGNVVDEMLMIREKYNPDIMWISDDVLTINRKWSLEFFQEVQRRGAVHPFECLSRVDLVDTEILMGLKQAGCFRIWYGAESGSQQVLDSMKKGTTVEQVRKAARTTQDMGIQAGFFILLGYPEETTADIRKTIDLLKETRPDVFGTSVAFPMRGTEFYSRVSERIIPNENWSSRNQNKLLFKAKYSRLYYWFAARWLVKEVHVDKMWRQQPRPYRRIALEALKCAVARAGVSLMDLAALHRTQPKRLEEKDERLRMQAR